MSLGVWLLLPLPAEGVGACVCVSGASFCCGLQLPCVARQRTTVLRGTLNFGPGIIILNVSEQLSCEGLHTLGWVFFVYQH